MLRAPLLGKYVRFGAVDVFRISLADWRTTGRGPNNYVVREAGSEDLASLADYFHDEQLVSNRLGRGDRCFVTTCKGQICAAVWLVAGPGDYMEDWGALHCVFRVPAGVGWTYDGKGTRLGAWGSLMARLPSLLCEFDLDEITTIIDCNNWQSIDSHTSLGYERAGMIACGGVFGLLRTVLKPSGGWWQFPPGRIGRLVVGLDRADVGSDREEIR
jgi:hypothetical protein